MSFTKEDKYMLDTQGVQLKRSFLTLGETDKINALIDDHLSNSPHPPYKFNFFELDLIFCEIMSREWIVEACEAFLGEHFRFDHCMGCQQPGSIAAKSGNLFDIDKGNLHGGALTNQGSVFYLTHGDQIMTGQLGLGISLSGQSESAGGFCYIPGSHKQSSCWGNGSQAFTETLDNKYHSAPIIVPELNKGDAFVFADNLVHGNTPLKEDYQRRALYYKYTPGFAAWRPHEEIKHYVQYATTDRQKKMLRAPYVASFGGDVAYSDSMWREKT